MSVLGCGRVARPHLVGPIRPDVRTFGLIHPWIGDPRHYPEERGLRTILSGEPSSGVRAKGGAATALGKERHVTYEMSVVDLPELHVIAIRGQHPAEEVPTFIGTAFDELFGHLGRLGVQPAGAPLVLYHAFGPDGVDADVCVPVAGPVPASGRIEIHVLPPVTCVRTLHVGPYDALSGAYAALTDWIDDHGFRPDGPVRERYLNGPGEATDPADFRTDIEMPVAVARAGEPALAGR